MDSIKEPTYQDLVDIIPKFIECELDIRVFRVPNREKYKNEALQTNKDDNMQTVLRNGENVLVSMFYIGNWPVEKKYPKDIPLTIDFLKGEITKIKKQQAFDHTVKPYPCRDIYYNILVKDLNDLCKLCDFWFRYKLIKSIKSNSESNKKDVKKDVKKNVKYENIHKEIAVAVLENKNELAKMLAISSGKSEYSDTLEGRVLQGDWQMAKELARERINSTIMSIINK